MLCLRISVAEPPHCGEAHAPATATDGISLNNFFFIINAHLIKT